MSNPKVRHQVDEASSDDVKLQVLQEDHVVTFKNVTHLIFNIMFHVRRIKIKRHVMKEKVENIITKLIEK